MRVDRRVCMRVDESWQFVWEFVNSNLLVKREQELTRVDRSVTYPCFRILTPSTLVQTHYLSNDAIHDRRAQIISWHGLWRRGLWLHASERYRRTLDLQERRQNNWYGLRQCGNLAEEFIWNSRRIGRRIYNVGWLCTLLFPCRWRKRGNRGTLCSRY